MIKYIFKICIYAKCIIKFTTLNNNFFIQLKTIQPIINFPSECDCPYN